MEEKRRKIGFTKKCKKRGHRQKRLTTDGDDAHHDKSVKTLVIHFIIIIMGTAHVDDDGNEFISPVDINEFFNNLQKRTSMLVTQFGMRTKVYIVLIYMVQSIVCVC